MIIVNPKGRLGNHIFIYNYIFNNSSSEELLITIKSDFFRIFDHNKKNVIQFPRFIFKVLYKAIYFFRFLFVQISFEKEIFGMEIFEKEIVIKNGYFKSIKIIDGFFQQYIYNNNKISIKNTLIEKLKEKHNLIFSANKRLIFIHQRNTDYKEFKVYDNTVWLNDNYYKEALNQMKIAEDIHFLIFSDDMIDLHSSLKKLKNKTLITGQNAIDDFILMSMCNGGILSNSTYSYFAAVLIDDPILLIAPKYWLGWKSKKWIPYGIKNPNFTYIDAKF